MPVLQNIAFYCGEINKIEGSSLEKSNKNQQKIDRKSMQIFIGKKRPQNALKSGFGKS